MCDVRLENVKKKKNFIEQIVDHGPVLRSVGKLLQSLFSVSFPQQGWRQRDLLRCAADVISLNKYLFRYYYEYVS